MRVFRITYLAEHNTFNIYRFSPRTLEERLIVEFLWSIFGIVYQHRAPTRAFGSNVLGIYCGFFPESFLMHFNLGEKFRRILFILYSTQFCCGLYAIHELWNSL